MIRLAGVVLVLCVSCELPPVDAGRVTVLEETVDVLANRVAVMEVQFGVHMDSLHTVGEQMRVMEGTLKALDRIRNQEK